MAIVYLIHFEIKMHRAQHYIGWSVNDSPEERLAVHLSGQGAKILRAANEKGISYQVVKVWRNKSRKFERLLKNRKKARCFCPVCNPAYYQKKQKSTVKRLKRMLNLN